MKKISFLIGLCLSPLAMADFAAPSFSPLVVGGTAVKSTEWIGQRVVALLNRGAFVCTATLISNKVALTAAHCVDGGGRFELAFNLKVRAVGNTKRKVTKYRMHPKYTGKFETNTPSDIALLFYSGGLPKSHKTMSFAGLKQVPKRNAVVTIAGFGDTKRNGTNGGGTLYKGDVKLREASPSSSELTTNQSGSTAICYGDSGGPIFMKDEISGSLLQLGIASRASMRVDGNQLVCGDTAIYTRVGYFRDWIDQEINK